MQAAWRMGRIGGLTLYLNYTWIIAAALIMWWVALLWLPEHFPTWGTLPSWLAAIAVVVLFALSVTAHELAHSAIARTGERTAILFPFGAAVPFQLRSTRAGRAFAAALAAPVFNLLLGGALLLLGSAIPDPEHMMGWVKALATALGWLNLLLGVLNLLPGIPFDGGWALAAGAYFFSYDREAGLSLARATGRVIALLLVFAGVWLGLTTDMWLQALGMVTVGWVAWEAVAAGQQRGVVRNLLAQLKARDVMEPNRGVEPVEESATVADMVRSHPKLPPTVPIPVVNVAGSLVGATTLGTAETLMQGTWASTPVRTISRPLSELHAVSPDTTLVEVLAAAHSTAVDTQALGQAPGQGPATGVDGATPDPDAVPRIPVVAGGELVGSIDPDRLYDFEEAGRQFGVQEALGPAGKAPAGAGGISRLLGRIWSFVPIAILLAALAILGNIALRTSPTKLQEAVSDPGSTITFSRFVPAEGDIVGVGEQVIGVQIEAARPVVSATITLDGRALPTELSGTSPQTRTAAAILPGLTLGPHTARLTASTESGERKSHEWQFRVVPGAPNTGIFPGAGAGAASTPTLTTSAAESVQLSDYRPALGARVPAGQGAVAISVNVTTSSGQEPQRVQVLLEGRELDSDIEPVQGTEDLYQVTASAPSLPSGRHRVRVEVVGSGGSLSTSEWTFSALMPNANNVYFKETGYFVSQPFLRYWQEHGGLALFGYPISDLIEETDEQTGEVYAAQYFERARFEQHPSLGDAVLLGRLGALLHEPEPAAESIDGAQFFPETGHNLSGTFRDYWNNNGGLAQFGFPISEERMEVNAIDGKEYRVQYFERARFELHPEFAGTPFEVQLGQLGTELYRQKYRG